VQDQLLFRLLDLAKELVPSTWMMSSALELRADLWTALLLHLVCTIVSILKTLVSDVGLVSIQLSLLLITTTTLLYFTHYTCNNTPLSIFFSLVAYPPHFISGMCTYILPSTFVRPIIIGLFMLTTYVTPLRISVCANGKRRREKQEIHNCFNT